ncbi:MAG TPA: hypothetical protein VF574_18745 [Allosphingosinicella sp.]|jgi:hypothetical protein
MGSENKPTKVADKDAAGTARRNRYFSGKLLTVADYALEQRYHIERRWLINRMLHGWGVVSGLEVGPRAEGGWRISAGMALDRAGRELVVLEPLDFEDDGDVIWLDGGRRIKPGEGRPGAGSASYLLSAHYAELWVDGVLIDDDYGDGACEANRVCETVGFSLTLDDPGAAQHQAIDADPSHSGKLTKMGPLHVDLERPVPLARVTVSVPDSGRPVLDGVDETYRPRPLGKTEPIARTGGPLRHEARVAIPAPAPPPPPPPEGDQE